MSFLGKVIYLLVFPGFFFLVSVSSIATFARREENAFSAWRRLIISTPKERDSANSINIAASVVRVLTLSWLSCILFGFFQGDLVLVFNLLLLQALCSSILDISSLEDLSKKDLLSYATVRFGWTIPLALAFVVTSLRCGEVMISGIISWQNVAGMAVTSTAGGLKALSGSVLSLLSALTASLGILGFAPFSSVKFKERRVEEILDAVVLSSDSAVYIVIPLLVTILFFAGKTQPWYEYIIWALKVIIVFIFLSVVDLILRKKRSMRFAFLALALGFVFGLLGLILV